MQAMQTRVLLFTGSILVIVLLTLGLACATFARGGGQAPDAPPPEVAGCSIFPADNFWNVPVDGLPLDPNSDAYIHTVGADAYVHADFGLTFIII